MEKAINEAIANIDYEIAELTERRKLLQDINNPNISNAEKWCLLRETPLRGDKEGMLKLAEAFIPGADEYLYDVNEVKVRMGLIDVSIPTSNKYDIQMSYNGMLVKKYPELEEPSNEEVFLKGYLNLLSSNASNWTLVKYYAPKANAVTRLIFTIKNKNKMRDVEAIQARYNKLKAERYERSKKLLAAYTTFGNEVSRFDALMYDKIKAFAGSKFRIQRNGIWY